MKKNILLFFCLIMGQITAWSIGPWQMKPPVNAEGRHRGLAISIGNRGYVGTGHYNGTGTNVMFNDWWEFDQSTNSWSQKANYPYLCQATIGWGSATKGYVGGGSVPSNQYFSYDPSTNSWAAIAPCPIYTTDREAFTINGKGYVMGSTQLYEYDPTTDVWTQKASYPVSTGSWICAFETASSGYVKSGSNFYEYKPANNTWIQRASFPGIMVNGGTAFSVHNKGYVIGGYFASLGDVTAEAWEYNPGNDTWLQLADFPGTARRFLSSFAIGNKGFVAIGTNGINFNDLWQFSYDPLDVVEMYLSANTVKTYPNPVVHQFTISVHPDFMETVRDAKIVVRATDGRIVAEQEVVKNTTLVHREGEKSGIYFYSIVKNNRVLYTGKLMYQ